MPKYKFTKKRTKPGQTDSPEKMHAIPVITNRLTTKSLCKVVTRNTSTSPVEAEATFNLVCEGIVHELQQGNSVQLGSLGWLRLSFSSEGVEDITKFDAASMIRDVRLLFTPSRELMSDIKKGLKFENAGVVEGGFTFPTTKAYLEYKETGKLPVEGGTESGSEPGSGQGSFG